MSAPARRPSKEEEALALLLAGDRDAFVRALARLAFEEEREREAALARRRYPR